MDVYYKDNNNIKNMEVFNMGQITFTGLASGLDTGSWIEALVSVKQQSVTNLKTKQSNFESSKNTLDTVKTSVSNLRSAIEKLTDAKFNGSFDLFTKNTVSSSNSSVVDATVSSDAARQSIDVIVNKLATATTAKSSFNAKIDNDTVFNTLSSGNAKEGKFSVFVDGKKSEIEIEENETLGDIIGKLNAIDGINASISDGKLSISGDEGKDIVIGSSSDESNFVSVLGLANMPTSYTYDSSLIAEDIDSSRIYQSLGSKATGKFSVFIDGEKSEINIGIYDTLSTVRSRLESLGIDTSFDDDGKLILDSNGHNVVLGADSDTSDFVSIMGFSKEPKDYAYSSYNAINAFDPSQKLSEAFGADVIGTFTIGNQEFTVNENTTLKSLINNINAKVDSGVNATWDAASGQLVLTSKYEGAFNINIEAGTSNLTNLLGFTSSEGIDGEGKYISSIVQNTQKLGDYAKININGSDLISSSNTVTSDISGIEGLTLNLKSVTKENESGEKEATNISVTQDTNAVLSAVKSFIDAYNKTIETIDSKTAKGENLYGDTSINTIRNNLRRTATAANDGSELKVLANIGITTGAASNTVDTTNVNKLQIDEAKFKEMLNTNPDAVKQLLLGDNTGTPEAGGILNKLEKITTDALAPVSGYFDSKAKSYDTQINSLKTSITTAQNKVDAYKNRLQKQFNSMEQAIAAMQQSYSQFSI